LISSTDQTHLSYVVLQTGTKGDSFLVPLDSSCFDGP